MERTVNGTTVAYKVDDETVYVITAINEVMGLLGATNIPANAKEHLALIWDDCGASKLIIFLPEEHTEHRAAARKLGFKQEGRLKKATPTGDLIIFGQYR
jgi:hypothetical protein